jgi:nitrate reductase NapAB chaperone NapD
MSSKEPLTRALVLKCPEQVFTRITKAIKETDGCQVVFITSSPGQLIVTEKKGGENDGCRK